MLYILRDNPDAKYQGGFESVQQKVGGVYKRFGKRALLRVTRDNDEEADYEWDPQQQPDDPQTKFAKKKIASLINGETDAFLSAAEFKEKLKEKGMHYCYLILI